MSYPQLLVVFLILGASLQAEEPRTDPQYAIYMGDNGVIVLKLQIQVADNSPQQLFQRYVDDLMKSLDADGDGVITVDEAKGKYLTCSEAMQAGLIPQSETPASKLTPDVSPADGKISRQEFLTYFKRMGLQPFHMVYQPRMMPATGNRRPRQVANTADVPLFGRLDSNADGRLSAAELKGALETLRKLDLDDDQTISAAELNPIATNDFVAQQQQTNAQAPSLSPILGMGSDESLAKQVRRLIDKYDSTDRDKSGVEGAKVRNQKLSPQELGLSAAAFARFDGDGDGQLDFDELRQFLTSPEPTLTIVANVNSTDPLQAESTLPEIQEKLKTTPDGAANINLGTTLLTINRQASFELASVESLLKPQFMAADRDANGYIDKSESEQAFLYGASFELLDTDKNQKVFLDEMTAYFKIRFDAARSRTVLTISEQGRTLFEILDIDRDRRLSFRELQIAADKLSLWDKDGDGLLSEAEVPLQYRMTIARGNLTAFGGNFRSDNQNGRPSEQTSGPIWFRKMDKNRDGEVSQREFLGEISAFEKLDSNRDGFIDLAEAVQTP